MCPIEIGAVQNEAASDQDVDALLYGKDGELTLEGEVIHDFLNFTDFSAVMDHEEAKPYLTTEEVFVRVNEDEDFDVVEETEEGAEKVTLETLDGSVAAQIVDEDDLAAMFDYFVRQLPEDTLEDKVRKAAFCESKQLDEAPFKKGAFRKIHKAGGGEQVKRMLMAMLNKEAIQRVASGSGYKAGDYKKHPSGYAPGTPKGIKKWRTYLMRAKAQVTRAGKKVVKQKRIAAKFGAKAKAKPGAKVTKKPAVKPGAAPAKKSMVASADPSNRPAVNEGVVLAAGIINVLKPTAPVAEEKKA